MTPGTHARHKGLRKVKIGNNLRDHMTDLELIFTMLGKASTTEIARRKDAQGLIPIARWRAKAGVLLATRARRWRQRVAGRWSARKII